MRRELVETAQGLFQDDTDNSHVVVTAEGIAPYTSQNNAFAQTNQARRTLELGLNLLMNQGNRCQGLAGQEGLSASGENFDPCSPLTSGGVGQAFGNPALTERAVQ